MFQQNVFMWIYRVNKNGLVIHLILQVLSYVTRCIRPLGSIASTGYTKTKHQLLTTNLCEERFSSYTSLSSVRWFTTITRLGTWYSQGNNFQNNQRNNQCNMGSFERSLFETTSRSNRLENHIQRILKSLELSTLYRGYWRETCCHWMS